METTICCICNIYMLLFVSVHVCDLFSQQGLQDGQVSSVLQGEHNDLPCVVEPWSSGHVELRAAR